MSESPILFSANEQGGWYFDMREISGLLYDPGKMTIFFRGHSMPSVIHNFPLDQFKKAAEIYVAFKNQDSK